MTIETKLLSIAGIVLVLDDLRHCYDSIKSNPQAQEAIAAIAPMFSHYASYADRERVYDLLKSDDIWDALPQATKWDVERKGREQFALCCGFLYVTLTDKETQEQIASMILTDEGFAARSATLSRHLGSLRQKKAAKIKAGAGAASLLGLNRQIKEADNDLKKLHQVILRQKGGIRKNINAITKAVKPFWLKGALLNNFISQVNSLYLKTITV